MSEQQQASFNGWAKIEVMGHQTHIGYVRTEAYGGAVLFRVDVPALPERDYVLEKPEYVDGNWTPAGAKVHRSGTEGHTVMVGASSIYRMTPCSEAAAMKAIESHTRPELKLIELPSHKTLPAPDEIRLEHDHSRPDDPDDIEDHHDYDPECPACQEEERRMRV